MMCQDRRSPRIAANAMLAVFLIAAQWGAVVHAFEHEAGTPLNQVCTTCVAASNLSAACIDSPTMVVAAPAYSVIDVTVNAEFTSRHSLTTRQRGPPLAQ